MFYYGFGLCKSEVLDNGFIFRIVFDLVHNKLEMDEFFVKFKFNYSS